MARKEILTVEVDDSKFSEFKRLFDRYQEALKKQPKAWDDVNTKTERAGDSSKSVADKWGQAAAHQGKLAAMAAGVGSALHSATGSAAGLLGHFHAIDKSIERATLSLVKWSTLTAAVGGLLGLGGGLFGIDRLASAVTANRRTALGLGMSYGQFSSAGVNLQRLVSDPQALLSGVASAKYDITSPQYAAMLAAGLTPGQVAAGTTASLTGDLLRRLPGLFSGTPKDMYGTRAHAMLLDTLLPQQDIVAYLNAPSDERQRMLERMAKDAGGMDVKTPAQEKWADLMTQLDRASRELQKTFAETLVRLEPGLEKLSNEFVEAFSAFMKTDLVDQAIKDMSSGLEAVADFVGGADFQNDVASLTRWIGDAAKAIWKFITSFGGAEPGEGPSDEARRRGLTFSSPPSPAASPYSPSSVPGMTPSSSRIPPVMPSMYSPPGMSPGAGTPPAGAYPNTMEGHNAFIRDYVNANYTGFPPELALAIAHYEGSNSLGWRTGSGATPGASDPDDWYDFQLNYRVGLGRQAAAAGIPPGSPNDWMRADAFAIDYMAQHGFGPWALDRGYQEWASAGRIPRVIIRRNPGSSPVHAAFLASDPTTAVPAGPAYSP